jgi:outer membrane receptor protein involved in Fe transport
MHFLALIRTLLIASALGAGVAAAEDPPAAASGETSRDAAAAKTPPQRNIEEIVIQAGESDAAADFEAGDSVAAFDASDLEALGAQSVADLAAFTPNLEIVTSGATTPTFFIRGVGLNDFSSNSSGAVAIYQNDVPLNSPALQLGTLFDVEAVNILRGPQGVGPYRNATAGAIKIYTRKPSGEFGGFLTQSYGNHDLMDYEGAVETPIYEDILSARFAFRLTERDGWMRNGCGNAPPIEDRGTTSQTIRKTDRYSSDGKPLSICGEGVQLDLQTGTNYSLIEENLPSRVNDSNSWSARGTLLFQPTLDMEWLLTAQGSRRDEQSRLGQAIGTAAPNYSGFAVFDPACLATLPQEGIQRANVNAPCRGNKVLGGQDGLAYQTWENRQRLVELDPCREPNGTRNGASNGTCTTPEARFLGANSAVWALAQELVDLDSEPWRGDFNRVGSTINDVWGVSLKGDVVLGDSVFMTSVSGYNTYDRSIDVDLDFSPNRLFEFVTTDDGWQFTQDLSFAGHVSENVPIRWEIGGFYLMEQLNVDVHAFFDPEVQRIINLRSRNYIQTLHSAAGYATLEWDFWEDFTLDGGFRWNWENKDIDYLFFPHTEGEGDAGMRCGETYPAVFVEGRRAPETGPQWGCPDFLNKTWQAPTGTVRLTYRFREDTHAYWKYTRGWKGGHYNATGSQTSLVGVAEPETVDAFEAGLRGSWFGGRLGLQGSIFHYNYENYQIFTAIQNLGSPPEFVVLNAERAEVYGAELDIVARPIPGMYLQARLSWLKSEFLDFVQFQQGRDIIGGQQVVVTREIQNSGNPLLNSPSYKVSLTAEQTLPLGKYGSVTARWDGAWTDDTNFDATDTLGIPAKNGDTFLPEGTIGQRAFWLHNFRLSYRNPSGNVEIAGWVRNLTDKAYKTFAFDGSTFQGTTIYFVGEPRTFGGTLTVNF